MRSAILFLSVSVVVSVLMTVGVEGSEWFELQTLEATEVLGDAEKFVTADIDRDGRVDVVFVASQSLQWFRSREGGFDAAVEIDALGLFHWGDVGDIDGSGSVDVVTLSAGGKEVVWHRNDNGDGLSWSRVGVANVTANPVSILVVDLDETGFPALVVIGQGFLTWFQFDGTSSFSGGNEWATPVSPLFLAADDIDGDGDVDILSNTDLLPVWYPNTDGQGTLGAPIAIHTEEETEFCLLVDLDGDGDKDVACVGDGSGSNAPVEMVENLGAGTFSNTTRVYDDTIEGTNIRFIDYDSDGDLDLITSAYLTKVNLYLNRGSWTWSEAIALKTTDNDDASGSVVLDVADLDGDGIPEILFSDDGLLTLAQVLVFQPPRNRWLVSTPALEVDADTPVSVTATLSNPFPSPLNSTFFKTVLYTGLSHGTSVTSGVSAVPFNLTLANATDPRVSVQTPVVADLVFTPTTFVPHLASLSFREQPLPGAPIFISINFNCAPGAYVGDTECIPCPIGTFSNGTASLSCTRCPPRMTSPPESTSFLNCQCPPGAWLGLGPRVEGQPCFACPVGARCPGGLASPVAAPGYFQSARATFVPCLRTGCAGNNTCAPGYRPGFMCSGCAEGYYSRTPSTCEQCPSGSGGRFASLVVGVILVALVMALVFVWLITSSSSASSGSTVGSTKQDHILMFRARKIPVSVSMVVTAAQLAGIIVEADFAWSSTSSDILSVFSLFTVNQQSLGSRCALQSFYTTYIVFILLPIVMVGMVIAFLVGGKVLAHVIPFLSGLSSVPTRTLIDSVLFTVAPLLYIPVSRSTFLLFDCIRLPNGDYVIEADNGVACFDSTWWSVFPLGLVCAALYLVGLPGYFGTTLFVRKHKLFEAETTVRFGSLYRNWRRKFYWGEVASLGKRLVVVASVTFLSQHQIVLILVILAVLVTSMCLVSQHQPYYVPFYNGVDIRLTGCVCALFLIGACFYSQRSTSSTDTLLVVFTILAVIALVAVSIHALVVDVLAIRQERKGEIASAEDRQKRLMGIISDELLDVEAGPELLHAAGDFLRVLGSVSQATGPGGSEHRYSVGEVEMGDLPS